ncbi:MAG: cysteine--tRNA ligase [Alphaproteobacteria bacterium]|nr:cysteine--tRNA ligase [Alphaproteobacteria bacterium]
MPKITFYNTLTRNDDVFTPMDAEHVKIYACGPTVYDRPHIGNARSAVIYDVLVRFLRHVYPQVTYARNITDVDDKINAAAKERGIAIHDLTREITGYFHADMDALNVARPDIEPRATEHIGEMVGMIKTLIEKGHAYAADGHALFAVASDPHYGCLSRRNRDELIAGARVEVAPYKKDPMDFVLWKPSAADEPGWESPWGRGRPGWHIECSAMSVKYLGDTFDIHGGGADLMFPHHENEIAQTTCATGGDFAKYWVHNGFLTINGEKMSKSLGNFTTVKDLLDKGVKGEVIRLALLSTHYRKPLDWNDKAIEDAEKTLNKFYRAIDGAEIGDVPEVFLNALGNDINVPEAIAQLHSAKPAELRAMGLLLGFFGKTTAEWFKGDVASDDDDIGLKIAERILAKKNKDWAASDRIRDELKAAGIVLEDKPDGTTDWRRA